MDAKGIRPDLGKVEVIFKQPCSNTITEVRAFLGAAGFFKKYIQDFSKIVILLHHITLNKVSSNKPFIFYTNASKEGIGIVLYQKDEDVKADYMIQYYSQTLAEG